MANELTTINAITSVCNYAQSIITSFRKVGYINSTQKEELSIKIDAAKKACASTQMTNLFDHNLECIDRATKHMAEKNFTGKALIAAEKEYDVLIEALNENLVAFRRHVQSMM